MPKEWSFRGNKEFWYHQGAIDVQYNTVVQGLHNITPYFREFAEKEASTFCAVARQIVVNTQAKIPYTQPAMCKKFDISKRAYEQAKMVATAQVSSAVACLENDIKMSKDRFARNIQKYFDASFDGSDDSKLLSLKKKIIASEQKLERLANKNGRPSVYMFGGHEYYQQHKYEDKIEWKKKYLKSRNCQFGAMGSKTDLSGNGMYRIFYTGTKVVRSTSRKQLVCTQIYCFKVTHHGHLCGELHLTADEGIPLRDILTINNRKQIFNNNIVKDKNGKEKEVRQMVTTGRIPLQVMFNREGNGWNIHISNELDMQPKPQTFAGTIGIDRNNGHIEATKTSFDTKGKFQLGEYRKLDYEAYKDSTAAIRTQYIYSYIHKLVAWAKKENCIIVLEVLNFEGIKNCENHPLCALLHAMPYKKFEKKLERECFIQGVELRYVLAAGTSLLGNMIATKYPQLSRDSAAGVCIGLRGTKEGNTFLAKLCREFVTKTTIKMRINCKGKCGQHVRIEKCLVSNSSNPRQEKTAKDRGHDESILDVSVMTDNQIQKYVGGIISRISKDLSWRWGSYKLKAKGTRTRVVCRRLADGSIEYDLTICKRKHKNHMERAAEARCTGLVKAPETASQHKIAQKAIIDPTISDYYTTEVVH